MLKQITVGHIEAKTSSKGTAYRVVTGGDGTKYNVWDGTVQISEGKVFECDVIPNTDPKFHPTIKTAEQFNSGSNGHEENDTVKTEIDENIRMIVLGKAIEYCSQANSTPESVVATAREFEKYVVAG